MKALILILILILMLCACSSINRHPVQIDCKGKGTISGTGYAGMNVGVGGYQSNMFTLQADCGDGFTYRASPPTPQK